MNIDLTPPPDLEQKLDALKIPVLGVNLASYQLEDSWPENLRSRLKDISYAKEGENLSTTDSLILILPDTHHEDYWPSQFIVIRDLIKEKTIDALFLECDNAHANLKGLERYRDERANIRNLSSDPDYMPISQALEAVKKPETRLYLRQLFGLDDGNLIADLTRNNLIMIIETMDTLINDDSITKVASQPGMPYLKEFWGEIPAYGVDNQEQRDQCYDIMMAANIKNALHAVTELKSRRGIPVLQDDAVKAALGSLQRRLLMRMEVCYDTLGNDIMTNLDRVYERVITRERSYTFIGNTRFLMEKNRLQVGLLVAGEGHIETMTERCREIGQSYVVLTPGYERK